MVTAGFLYHNKTSSKHLLFLIILKFSTHQGNRWDYKSSLIETKKQLTQRNSPGLWTRAVTKSREMDGGFIFTRTLVRKAADSAYF